MKNTKGFTLIELLAVIVILAIIALIATPMIMDVIDKARKGAVEASAYGYVQAVEDQSVYSLVDMTTGIAPGFYDVTSTDQNNPITKVQVKGEKPTAGWVAVGDNGVVVAAYLQFSSYSKWVGYTPENHAKATLDADSLNNITTSGSNMSTLSEANAAVNALIAPKTNS